MVSFKVYQNVSGSVVRLNTFQNIVAAVTVSVLYTDPYGNMGSWPAVVDATYYVKATIPTLATSVYGKWFLQPFVDLGAWVGPGSTVMMEVIQRGR